MIKTILSEIVYLHLLRECLNFIIRDAQVLLT